MALSISLPPSVWPVGWKKIRLFGFMTNMISGVSSRLRWNWSGWPEDAKTRSLSGNFNAEFWLPTVTCCWELPVMTGLPEFIASILKDIIALYCMGHSVRYVWNSRQIKRWTCSDGLTILQLPNYSFVMKIWTGFNNWHIRICVLPDLFSARVNWSVIKIRRVRSWKEHCFIR